MWKHKCSFPSPGPKPVASASGQSPADSHSPSGAANYSLRAQCRYQRPTKPVSRSYAMGGERGAPTRSVGKRSLAAPRNPSKDYRNKPQRSEISTHSAVSGPTYSAEGRIIRFLARCSLTCAAHPVTRDITNIGVNNLVGIPIK